MWVVSILVYWQHPLSVLLAPLIHILFHDLSSRFPLSHLCTPLNIMTFHLDSINMVFQKASGSDKVRSQSLLPSGPKHRIASERSIRLKAACVGHLSMHISLTLHQLMISQVYRSEIRILWVRSLLVGLKRLKFICRWPCSHKHGVFFQTHFCYWQNSAPYTCRTEVSISFWLLARDCSQLPEAPLPSKPATAHWIISSQSKSLFLEGVIWLS